MRDSDRQIPRPVSHHPHPRAPAQADRPPPLDEADRHLHRIAVETGPEPVFVTIGRPPGSPALSSASGPSDMIPALSQAGGSGHAPVPGGFAKLFNRVIDCGAWAGLPEAARAVYVPMVRFAEGRDGYRVRIGLAGLMKYTRLSRSSVKRALRALLEARLIAIVRAGGVAPDGTNRTNVYQLLLPELEGGEAAPHYGGDSPPVTAALRSRAGLAAKGSGARQPPQHGRERAGDSPAPRGPQSAARAKRGGTSANQVGATGGSPLPAPAAPVTAPPDASLQSQIAFSISSWGEATTNAAPPASPIPCALPRGSSPNPLSAPAWSPAPLSAEPPAGPSSVPAGGRGANPAAGPTATGTESAAEPVHRANKSYAISEVVDDDSFEFDGMMPEAEPALSQQQRKLRTLLEAWGVDTQVALDVVRSYTPAQIVRAVSSARQAKSRGGLLNPAGYVVRCLDGLPGGTAAAAHGRCAETVRVASHELGRRAEEERATAARAAADARIDELDEPTLGHLAGRVLAMHADRPAMLRLLSARPARESRLMRAEIAALLEV